MKLTDYRFHMLILLLTFSNIAFSQPLLPKEEKSGLDRVITFDTLPKVEQPYNSLVVPYRPGASTQLKEKYPANNIYKTWTQEFLTPFSYAKAAVPDTLRITLNSFVFPHEGRITSHFGKRSRGRHYGIDIKLKVGDTVRAAFEGKVRIVKYQPRGYGNYIVIRHPNGLETIYGHLSKQLVKINQEVYAGEPIGLGGNTGRSTGPHLHFETRVLGNPINPAEIANFDTKSLLAETVFYSHKNKKIIRTKRS